MFKPKKLKSNLFILIRVNNLENMVWIHDLHKVTRLVKTIKLVQEPMTRVIYYSRGYKGMEKLSGSRKWKILKCSLGSFPKEKCYQVCVSAT